MFKKCFQLPRVTSKSIYGQRCVTFLKAKSKVVSYVDTEHRFLLITSRYYTVDSISRIKTGPSLKYFIDKTQPTNSVQPVIPLISERNPENNFNGENRKVYIETYGCQMNVSDTEIALSVLLKNGFKRTTSIVDADVILVMTCAIREGAEEKIWKRLEYYKLMKIKRQKISGKTPIKIGILGCMAERLKTKILEREKMVDVLCGPDAYRDLPKLLAITESNQSAANVQLSLEETYADITPVRINADSTSAFVSIMRGCDNMCSYCIVPFTRGRERSRPISSIRNEVKDLAIHGVKEIVLLGQNVNSFRDLSETNLTGNENYSFSAGFRSVYKTKHGGLRFADLLDKISSENPELRIRFTSPHPKDFPDEVLHLIRDGSNICKQIHLPAQSGNSEVLEKMRRGYTRNAYLELVEHIRDIIPDVALSSDFISGFCGETEEAHQDTLSLMEKVKFNFCYCFQYSMREKTRAFHRLVDDVDQEVKRRRTDELVETFRKISHQLHQSQIGEEQLVLVEGNSKRCHNDLAGRNDSNTKVIFPKVSLPRVSQDSEPIKPGDYVVVKITDCTSQVLKGVPMHQSSITEFHSDQPCIKFQYNQSSHVC